jgi:hypothetical protein
MENIPQKTYFKKIKKQLLLFCIFLSSLTASAVSNAQNKPFFDFYGSNAIGSNRGFDNQAIDNEYVDTARGVLHFDYTDMFIPGNGGFDLSIKRWYSSRKADPKDPSLRNNYGLIPGWNMGFGSATIVREQSNCNKATRDNVFFEMPNGGAAERMTSTLTTNFDKIIETNGGFSNVSTGVVTLVNKNGTQYEMSRIVSGPFNSIFYAGCTTQKWLTTKIIDANGNYALINYDTANEPLSVVTNDGRIVNYTKI